MGVGSSFDGLVAPAVQVVGGAFELDAVYPRGTRVFRTWPRAIEPSPPIALLVLDARTQPLGTLAQIRRSPPFETVPALAVADDEHDPALAELAVDDVLADPFGGTAVVNRVRTLIELGRTRSLVLQRQTFDQAILDGVDVGIITTDAMGSVTFVNRCAREVLRREAPLRGEDVRKLLALDPDEGADLDWLSERRWTHALRAGDHEIEIDLAIRRADEAAQEHLGFFFIFHDRTHEKQLEMERRRFERLAAMGTMVAGFAHEVRNPVASLRSIAESLGEELAEAHVKLPHVDRMLQVLERIERLVRTSLLFGRPSPPRPAAHRPSSILAAAASSLAPRTRAFGEEIRVDVDPELPEVYVDDGQIVQVLVILLNNALDATSAHRVSLRAQLGRISDDRPRRPTTPFVRFDVRDDGPGIPPDIMGRIFDPFFTTKATGTGLGLSIAQQLVTENGARIELTSALDAGTTFSVLAPLNRS